MDCSTLKKSLLTLPIVFSSAQLYAATNFEEAMKNITTSGLLRAAYISVNPDVSGNNTTSAAAVAGQIKIETGSWNGLQFGIAPYFVEKIETLSGGEAQGKLNSDFFDSNNDSYAYLGEAYANYTYGNGNLRIGRQLLDNPFINTDDIRMHPNTFDAVWATYKLNETLNIEGGKVQRWAGLDSGGSQDKFKDASNGGVTAVGATYAMKPHHVFQAWYYDFDKSHSQLYFDANYTNGNFEAGLQYSSYSEDNASNIDGTAYGLSATYTLDKFAFGIALNEGSNDTGKSVDNGLGGGNFFTSMDETTIGGITDASAHILSVSYAISADFSISLATGHFEDGTGTATDIDETNLNLAYAFNDHADVAFTYTEVDNAAATTDAGTNFSRQFVRINYHF